MSLTDVLSQAGYDYLIPTPPIIDEVDQTFTLLLLGVRATEVALLEDQVFGP